jgi:hypothetical protein
MTGDEVDRLLKRIVDSWPASNWTDGTLAIWREELRETAREIVAPNGQQIDVAKRAYETLKARLSRMPTIADWRAEYRAATPRPEWQPPLDDDPYVTPERGLEHVAAVRAELAARGHKT